jgi:hypothetical protein
MVQPLSPTAKVSVVIYTPGRELYQVFGHICIRFKDEGFATKDGKTLDALFNFGGFDESDPWFVLHFAKGDMLYSLFLSLSQEMPMVAKDGQGVNELPLDLTREQKQQLFDALVINLKNPSYYYEFLEDNCSTRVRDAIEAVTDIRLDAPDAQRTFREMVNPYLDRIPWTQFGINLLLGPDVDRVATPREFCFLPKELQSALEIARVGGKKLVPETMTDFTPKPLPTPNLFFSPDFWLPLVALAWVATWYFRREQHSLRLTGIYFVLIGIAGLFLAMVWGMSRYSEVHNNLNLIWLFPFHFIAGLWLLIKGDFQSKFFSCYFKVTAVATLVFAVVSPLLPQAFPLAIYPLVALVIWRSALAGFLTAGSAASADLGF